MKRPTRLLRKHVAGCAALRYAKEGTWDSPWVLPVTVWERRDRLGRSNKRTSTHWLKYRCNTYDCPAEIIVLGDFSDLLPFGEPSVGAPPEQSTPTSTTPESPIDKK